TKNRGEVSGGGKKPWRQKGTGRARHGSIRSPIWIGGGVTHGPRNERVYDQKINKRMRRKALLVSLSAKAENHEIVIIDEFAFSETRTRHAASLFRALAAHGFSDIAKKKGSTLVTLPTHDVSAVRVLRNVPHVASCEARNSTAGMVLSAKYVVVPKTSLPVFEALSTSKSK
ncbi:MAG: large subunit ribosomal protein L4, partial [Parcubacteria group bacterium Gr01-1014_70]